MAKVTDMDTSTAQPSEFQRYSSIQMQNVVTILNKGIQIRDNFDCTIADVEFASANADVEVSHNLSRPPLGYFAVGLSAAMIIYTGSVPANSSKITLKSSAAGSAKIVIV